MVTNFWKTFCPRLLVKSWKNKLLTQFPPQFPPEALRNWLSFPSFSTFWTVMSVVPPTSMEKKNKTHNTNDYWQIKKFIYNCPSALVTVPVENLRGDIKLSACKIQMYVLTCMISLCNVWNLLYTCNKHLYTGKKF